MGGWACERRVAERRSRALTSTIASETRGDYACEPIDEAVKISDLEINDITMISEDLNQSTGGDIGDPFGEIQA